MVDGSARVRRDAASDAPAHRTKPLPPDSERPADAAPTRADSGPTGSSGTQRATPSDTDSNGAGTEAPVATVLREPREGIPAPVADREALAAMVSRFGAGTGPVAIDAERASGYRYSQRAYLVQLRRAGAGTALVDPIPLAEAGVDLSMLADAIADAEWVLHAASQDLPCLADLAMRPQLLFDTELAARLAGFERVGLAAITERLLGYTLEKHHSAADWSSRPLPSSWLAYAALDVELLVALRDALAEELDRQNKSEWARQEFAALITARPPRPRSDPWRRTSGIHRVRGTRGLARVRALWTARDEAARRRDVAPGRVLPDAAIVAAAQADPADERALLAIPGFGNRGARRLTRTWLAAVREARALPESQLPPVSVPAEGPPPPHRWPERDPAAAARLARCRAAVTSIAAQHRLPVENLLSPDTVRRLAWTPPPSVGTAEVESFLVEHGARAWQVELTRVRLAEALADD